MKEASKKILTIPNLITLFRLLLIPAIIVTYVVYDLHILVLIFLVLSAISDLLDGFIARKFNMVSHFGRIFYPMVDKLTVISLLFALSTTYKIMLYFALLIMAKELFSGIIGLFVFCKIKKTINSEWHGKITTLLIYLLIFTHVIFQDISKVYTYVLIGICTIALINSCVLYVRRFLKERRTYLNKDASK